MFKYEMSETGKAFHECDKQLKFACGPYGSGKSCFVAIDVLAYACAQAPAPDGVRYSRVGVLRATYPELTTATRKSLLEVLPKDCGSITSVGAPLRGVYNIPLADGTVVNLELVLFAVKTADDCEKILSANWTFAWINEATGVAPEVLAKVRSRVGRYPPAEMGGVSWGGVLLDFNQPAHGTWLYNTLKEPPEDGAVFIQPPAAFMVKDDQDRVTYEMNPNAENLHNLGARQEGDPDTSTLTPEEFEKWSLMKGQRYYKGQIDSYLRLGRDDIVQNMFCMMDVPIIEGKPVYQNSFSTTRHIAPTVIEPKPFVDVIIGIDQSGIHPAAVFLQNINHKWCVLDEIYAENEGFENFLYGIMIPLLRSRYSTSRVLAVIDPSNQRDSWQAMKPSERLEEAGVPVISWVTNSPKTRIQTVDYMLNLEYGGIVISPLCENLIRGFTSDYRYRRLRAAGSIDAAYTHEPEKNSSSHYHDALQYACLYIINGNKSSDISDELSAKLSQQRKILRSIV